ncbi:hypothetical protein MTO96_026262 [Rhipicephalus appendiculatus]
MQLHRPCASRDEAHMQTLRELAIPLLKERAHAGASGGNNSGSVGCGGTGNGTSMAPSALLRVNALPISLQNIANGHQGRPSKLSFSVRDILDLPEVKSGCSSPSYIGSNGQSSVLPAGAGGTALGGGSVGGGVSAADLCGGPAGGWSTAGHVHGGNPSSGALGQDLGASPYSLHYGGMCADPAYRWFHPTPDMLSYSALGEST